MKSKLLLFSILIMLVMTVMPFNLVSGASGDVTLVDWSGYNYGESDGTGALSSQYVIINKTSGPTFDVYNANVFGTDNKVLRLNVPATVGNTGWINLTEDFEYINSISIAFAADFARDSVAKADFVFYNDSIEVLYFGFEASLVNGNDDILYKDVSGVEHKLDDNANEYLTDYYLNITHVIGNTMNYTLHDMTDDVYFYAEDSSRSIYTWTTFDSIYIDFPNYTDDVYIDDIIINTEMAEGGGDESFTYHDITGYGYIGNYGYGTTLAVEDQYIETKFNTKFSGTINYVDLLVSGVQLETVSNDMSDYTLYVNGIPFGNPVTHYPFPYSTQLDVLRWYSSSGTTLDEEFPIFSFGSSKSYAGTYGDTIGIM